MLTLVESLMLLVSEFRALTALLQKEYFLVFEILYSVLISFLVGLHQADADGLTLKNLSGSMSAILILKILYLPPVTFQSPMF